MMLQELKNITRKKIEQTFITIVRLKNNKRVCVSDLRVYIYRVIFSKYEEKYIHVAFGYFYLCNDMQYFCNK